MKRQKHIFVWIACCLLLVAAIVAGIVLVVRRDRAMHGALMDLQAANQAGTVFTSDSAAQELARYFDEPWHRRNDRVLAHYLLGRAHADMGETPQAIEDYQTAIECADTTDEDCDFRILRNVYGQMAEVFHAQNLPEDEIEAQMMFNKYSWVIGDTLFAIVGYQSLEGPYYLLGEYDSVLAVNKKAREQFLTNGYQDLSARTLMTPIYLYIEEQEYEKAKQGIDIVRSEANIFNEDGTLKPGHEKFYYTLGLYFDCLDQLDSAEYYYRRGLAAGESEAGYKGLLSVYSKREIADSIAMFAPLYVDANDAYHDSLRTAEVHKTATLYNYNRHRRQVELERRSRQQAQTALMIISFVCVVLITVFYFVHRQHRKEKEQMSHDLQRAEKDLMATNQEIVVLRQAANKGEGMESLLAMREKKVQELQDQIAYLKEKIKIRPDTDITSESAKADIINHFRTISRSHILREGNQAKPVPPRAASEKEWKVLTGMMRIHYPQFFLFVTSEHRLTQQEYRICLLSRLSFEPSAIATLLDTSLPTVSNARKRIAGKLFQLDSATTLDEELMELS